MSCGCPSSQNFTLESHLISVLEHPLSFPAPLLGFQLVELLLFVCYPPKVISLSERSRQRLGAKLTLQFVLEGAPSDVEIVVPPYANVTFFAVDDCVDCWDPINIAS